MPNLSHLLLSVPNIIHTPAADPPITAPITEDSRAVQPGGLFVARTGGSTDGHTYIPNAVEAGAAAIVGERPPVDFDLPALYVQVEDAALALAHLAAAYYDFPSRHLVMIGVTGTDGKTTTTNLIYSILRAAGRNTGMISTINARIGTEIHDVGLHVTTPTAPEVQKYLRQMVDSGLTHCVLEATSHGLAQHRVSACDFDVAVVTNIQHEHLDFHGSWENYRDAKAELFHHLIRGARKGNAPKVAVVNLDDENSRDHLMAIPADRHITYTTSADVPAGLDARNITFEPDATRFTLRMPGAGKPRVGSSLIGEFNISNILAAASAAFSLDIDPAHIVAGIEAVQSIPGRMERIDEGQPFLAVVDFAHTPNALRRTLEAARLMIPSSGRVIVVFGSAGLRDPDKRAMMGRIAAELADLTIITAEDPRTESLADIIAASARAAEEVGAIEDEAYWRIPDRGQAIHFATQLARQNDIVLACGKGHEQSMCFGTVEHPWDDRDAMRSALRGTPLLTLPTADDL